MQDGYHLNIARYTDQFGWQPYTFVSEHFAAVYLGRDARIARERVAEFRKRFPEGDQPGDFKLTVTHWQSRGEGMDF